MYMPVFLLHAIHWYPHAKSIHFLFTFVYSFMSTYITHEQKVACGFKIRIRLLYDLAVVKSYIQPKAEASIQLKLKLLFKTDYSSENILKDYVLSPHVSCAGHDKHE